MSFSATNLTGLASILELQERVYYRLMAAHIDGELRVTRLIIGPQPTWKRYNYNDVVFIAGTEYGKTVADWLLSGKTTSRYIESIPIIPINNHVDSYRYPSHSQAGLFTFSKPATMYRASFSQAVPGRNYEFTSEGAPFFLTLWEAERHLLYGVPEDAVSSPAQTSEAGVYAYIEDSEAWLARIHFSLTALELHLAGTSLNRTKLKVVGSGIRGYDDYPMQNIVSIPLPNGRPDYLKIALIKDNSWLDYFIDDKNFRSNPLNPRRMNVTFAEPEPMEKVRELIDRGEGRSIEFKAEISLSSGKLKWLKTVAAFANGDGGSVILGVSDEDGSIVGINSMLPQYQNLISKFKDAITLAISDTIDPVPEYDFVDAHIDDRDILAINVHANLTRCYAIYLNKEVPTYYIRRGATTRVADNNEVQELIRSKSAYSSVAFSPLSNY